jgi:Family of unknown function (DUF6152)
MAVFDAETRIELRGVVVDFKLRNPHASFIVDAQQFVDSEPRGDTERWEIESQAPSMLRSLGIDAQTFEPGDEITIIAAPHRDRSFKFAHSVEIVDAFGSEYRMANSDRLFSPSLLAAAGASSEQPSEALTTEGIAKLNGRWQQPLVDVAGHGPALPLNEAGMAAWRGYDAKRSPANTCEPKNVPDSFFAPFFMFELQVDERQASLRNEEYGTVRIVPLKGTRALAEPSGRFGTVKGRIAGDTLVVLSRGYPESRWGLGVEEFHGGADIPSSDQKELQEWFSVTPDGRTLVYEYALKDRAYMTRPHEGRVELTRVPDDVGMYTSQCDLESASMWSRDRGNPPLRVGTEP